MQKANKDEKLTRHSYEDSQEGGGHSGNEGDKLGRRNSLNAKGHPEIYEEGEGMVGTVHPEK